MTLSKASIYVLVDNEANEGFISEWGLSLYVETNEWKALFDSGGSASVIRYNAEELGLDLKSIDFGFLSHHHGDHYGGFKYVGSIKPSLNIYTPPGDVSYLIEWGLKPIVVDKPLTISSSVWSTGPLRLRLWGIREHSMVIYVKGKGLVILVGCSHPGLKTIIDKALEVTGINDIYLIIGGFHSPPLNEIDYIAGKARFIAPLHCSGALVKEYLAMKYPDKYVALRAGDKLNIR